MQLVVVAGPALPDELTGHRFPPIYLAVEARRDQSVTTATGAPGVDCPTSGGTTTSYTYDSADRLNGSGYVYDAFGRATTAGGNGTVAYFVDDLPQQQPAGTKRQTWTLDPAHRVRATVAATGSGTSWTTTATRVNHYCSDSDNPRRVGGKQRAGDTASGLLVLGVRLYDPVTSRFLSLDPVYGGGDNLYGYPADPVSQFDLDGQAWKCKAKCALVGNDATFRGAVCWGTYGSICGCGP
jgi:RHS repeat-associated protein